ncbi:MAG TPA: DNA polymerase III subunit gamma/tau C-terminal domain-containing protein, partial [Burkholderiaceae bacterium]
CLQFNLRPMAPETVQQHLAHVLAAEHIPADAAALRLLSRAARGSMRDALSLTDQAIAFGSGKLEEATVRQMLGSVDRSYVFRLIDALARGDGKTVVETAEALRVNGLSAASTLEDMGAVLQRMAVLQAVPQMAEATDAGDAEAAETMRLSALMPADETQLLYSICLHGRGELGLAPDEYAALTMTLLRLLAFKPAGRQAQAAAPTVPTEKKTLTPPEPSPPSPPAALPSAAPVGAEPAHSAPAVRPQAEQEPSIDDEPPPWLDDVPPSDEDDAMDANAPPRPVPPAVAQRAGAVLSVVQRPVPASTPVPLSADAQVVAVPVRMQPEPGERTQPRADTPVRQALTQFTPTEEGDFWHAIVQRLVAAEAITALARELALQSQLVARDGPHWLLRVERESLNQPTARERLRAALHEAGLTEQIGVEVGVVIDSPARRNAHAAQQRQNAAVELIEGDAFVQQMVRDWGARIVPGSIKPL